MYLSMSMGWVSANCVQVCTGRHCAHNSLCFKLRQA